MLHVTLTNHSRDKSVSVFDSDLLGNLIHMEALVGTLVRYGSRGVYEPYFAKGWSTNETSTEFKFFIENDLLDESGHPLDAESYFNSIHVLLKKFSQTTEPPVFSNLVGWDKFKKSETKFISGITYSSESNTITFVFEKSASGLMEFLAMPYYGFYNPNDFNDDGSWKDIRKITATGGYRLKSISNSEVVLSKRQNFKLLNKDTYENITINSEGTGAVGEITKNHVFIHNSALQFKTNSPPLKTFKSTPTLLFLFEINPKSKLFSDHNLRTSFYNLLKGVSQNAVSTNPEFTVARGFYSDNSIENVSSNTEFDKTNKVIYLKKKNLNPTKYDRIADLILNNLTEAHELQIEIKENQPGCGYIKPQEFNQNFDFRIKAADIGYAPENWVIKMMFCSNLGVTFPDPNSEIKNLTEKFDAGLIPNEKHYAENFEKILVQQATLVPIFRDGYSFSISDGVDPLSLSRTTNVPRIDLIKPLR